MMPAQTTVTGVILAGGLARRMDGRDKGLVPYRNKPLVSYAIDTLSAVTPEIIISANRNLDRYRSFGVRVVPDLTGTFDGPLAGILSAMRESNTDLLAVLPCDSPLFRREHLIRLLAERATKDWEIAAAHDGKRLHPLFLVLKTSLRNSLDAYLASGGRKVERWLTAHRFVQVDFHDEPEIFANINTLAELTALEHDYPS